MSRKPAYVEYGEESNVHGIKEITNTSSSAMRRLLWASFVVACAGILFNNTARQIIRYFEYEHVTKFDLQYTHKLEFPAVTVCNVNKNRRSALTPSDIVKMGTHLDIVDENFTLFHEELYPEDWVNDVFTGRDWDAVITANEDEKFDMLDFANRTGMQFDEMVQHCKWRSNLCNSSVWTEEFTHYGKCFTFNRDSSKILFKAGAGNGLEILINVQHEEYLSSHRSEDLGIKFLPHSSIDPPFLKELGFGLAPGYHYLIALQQREVISLPYPYGDCVEDHVTRFYPNYTVPGCRIECETLIVFNRCGCKLVESPGEYPLCTPDEFDCAEQVLTSIEESDECICQNPCTSIQHPFRLSMLELRKSSLDLLKKQHPIPDHLTRDDLILLNIYYDTLAYERVEQVPAYTILDILSDLGGTMGLWLGASVLAIMQFIEFLGKICMEKCKCCTNNAGEKSRRERAVSPLELETNGNKQPLTDP